MMMIMFHIQNQMMIKKKGLSICLPRCDGRMIVSIIDCRQKKMNEWMHYSHSSFTYIHRNDSNFFSNMIIMSPKPFHKQTNVNVIQCFVIFKDNSDNDDDDYDGKKNWLKNTQSKSSNIITGHDHHIWLWGDMYVCGHLYTKTSLFLSSKKW